MARTQPILQKHRRNTHLQSCGRSAQHFRQSRGTATSSRVSFRCLFRVHRAMLTSIVRRADRYTALCDDCGLPLERSEEGRWAPPEPLVSRKGQAA
jgi:hypothetical protein